MESTPSPARPRAVLATRIYAPESAAAAFRLAAIARGLARAGIGVEVLTAQLPGRSGRSSERPMPGLRIRRWPVKRDESGTVRGYLEYLSFDIPLAARLLLAPRADVIIAEPPPTTGLVALIAAKLRGARFAYTVPDLWADGAAAAGMPGTVVTLLGAVERAVLRSADVLLATSPETAERAAQAGARRERIVMVGNGADDAIFTPGGPRVECDGPLFVHAGTLSEWQGCEVLVRAMPAVLARHPDARLVFLGEGSQRLQLEELAAQLAPGSIEFLGRVPPAEAARWQRSATAAIACNTPGIGYSYARPTKVFAATACGTPVVYVGAGPFAEEVPAARIGVAADYSPEAVATALIALADEPLAAEDRDRIARWTEDNASLTAVGTRAAEAITELLS